MRLNEGQNAFAEEVRNKIGDKSLKNIKIFAYKITDSTNTRAKEYAVEDGAVFPAVFIADGQSAGRGRRGRSFDSAEGAGLYISFLFRPEEKGLDAVKLTVRAAVETCAALEEVTGLFAQIKWVNDIFVGDRKLAGILAEGQVDSESGVFEYAVCGIGINLNKRTFPEELSKTVTTVEDETGARPDRAALAARLTERFFAKDGISVMEEYRRRSCVIGKELSVRRISGEVFSARAVSITDGGALTVIREDGQKEDLISAEVSVNVKTK